MTEHFFPLLLMVGSLKKTGAVVVGWVAVFAALAGLWVTLVTPRPPLGSFAPSRQVAREFRQLLARDAIAPVYEPEFVPAAEARLSPEELVIGVEIAGRARAYPVGFLNWREMVNDRIGPIPFLVTW
jgi:hypothetical protein